MPDSFILVDHDTLYGTMPLINGCGLNFQFKKKNILSKVKAKFLVNSEVGSHIYPSRYILCVMDKIEQNKYSRVIFKDT